MREQQQVAGGHGDLQHEQEIFVESAGEEAPIVLRPRISKKPAWYRDEEEGRISPQTRKRVQAQAKKAKRNRLPDGTAFF